MYRWSLNGGRVAGDPDEWLPSNLMRFHWELLDYHLHNMHLLLKRNPLVDEMGIYTVLVGAYRIPVGFVPFRARLARASGGPQRIGDFVGTSCTEIFVRLIEETAIRLFWHLPDELRAVAPQRESEEFQVRATAIAERLRDRDAGLPLSWSKIDFGDLATRIDREVLACSDIERSVYPAVYDEEDVPRPSNVHDLLYFNHSTRIPLDPELLFAENPFPFERLEIISRHNPNHSGPNDWVGYRLRGAIPDHLLPTGLLEAVRHSRRAQGTPVDFQPTVELTTVPKTHPKQGDPEPQLSSPSGRVQLFGLSESPVVDGVRVDKLTRTRYDVVAFLIRKGTDGAKKSELESVSGDAVNVLKSLAKIPIWSAVIALPGVPGRGYRIH
jgi:hypothetical protein